MQDIHTPTEPPPPLPHPPPLPPPDCGASVVSAGGFYPQLAEVRGADPATAALFLTLGVGSWVTINGLFQELPLLVDRLPEGWALASHLTVVIQLANVGPVGLLGLRRLARRQGADWALAPLRNCDLVVCATVCVLALNVAAMVALGCGLWDTTARVDGSSRSVGLLTFAFVAALADDTSSLTFWAFASRFPPAHLAALAAGEGCSALVTSLLATIQDPGADSPRFSAGVYFLSLAAVTTVCGASFAALLRLPAAKRAPLTPAPAFEAVPLLNASDDGVSRARDTRLLLISLSAVNFSQNGMLTALQPFAAKPYGGQAYHAAVTAGMVTQPFGALLLLLVPARWPTLAVATAGWVAPALYTALLAGASPDPWLKGTASGSFLVAFAAGLSGFAQTYAKTAALRMLGDRGTEGSIVIAGAWIQGGAFLGAALFFVLVNFTDAFTGSDSGSAGSDTAPVA